MDPHTLSEPRRDRSAGRAWPTVLGLVLTAAVAIWSLIGPQREDVSILGAPPRVVDKDYYTYIVRVPDAPQVAELAVGSVALEATLGLAVVLLRFPPLRARGTIGSSSRSAPPSSPAWSSAVAAASSPPAPSARTSAGAWSSCSELPSPLRCW